MSSIFCLSKMMVAASCAASQDADAPSYCFHCSLHMLWRHALAGAEHVHLSASHFSAVARMLPGLNAAAVGLITAAVFQLSFSVRANSPSPIASTCIGAPPLINPLFVCPPGSPWCSSCPITCLLSRPWNLRHSPASLIRFAVRQIRFQLSGVEQSIFSVLAGSARLAPHL